MERERARPADGPGVASQVKDLVTRTPSDRARAGLGREGWMDVLRGLAVLLVVLFHAAYLSGEAGLTLPEVVADLNDGLAPFRIPTLVALSGMLLGPSLAKPASRYFAGKWRNIVWPYLLWTAVFTAVTLPAPALALTYLSGGTYLWFLLFLSIFYAAAWLLRRVPTVCLVTVPLLLSLVAPTGSKYTERMLYLFGLFMLGHLLRSSPWLWQWVTRSWTAPLLGAVLVGLQLGAIGGGLYGPRTFIGTVGGLLLGAQVAVRLSRSPALTPLRHLGRNSLVYYVVHYPVLLVSIAAATSIGLTRGDGVAAAAAGVALAVSSLLARYRDAGPVRWLFAAPGPVPEARRRG